MTRNPLVGWIAAMGLLAVASRSLGADVAAPTPLQVFERRIMPIFKSPQPSSCVQCHLASVDLKHYIRPSHQQTFVSLRDQGLIDLAQPGKSKILTLIQMGDKDLDPGARLIHEPTRQAEYTAFAAWIQACCDDPQLRELPALAPADLARPPRPAEVIRHTRKSRVVDSFVRHIWSQRMRCFPCHTPHELDESNPKHAGAIGRHKGFVEKLGPQVAERLHLFRETPEATLQSLIEKSRQPKPGELPLLNLAQPRKSLLVLKPTSKLPAKNDRGEFDPPAYSEPVSHMGGLKMHVDDPSYKAFLAWIQDYARVVGDHYTSVDDLPADNWYASKHVLMMREVPAAWPVGRRVQFFLHAWNDQTGDWQPKPVAFTQGSVTPLRNVAGSLFLFGPGREAKENPLDRENARLAPGKYLLKAYVDSQQRLAKDPTLLLGEEDYFGQLELAANWREGFPFAEKPSGKLLK
jgi:hypothetical protein